MPNHYSFEDNFNVLNLNISDFSLWIFLQIKFLKIIPKSPTPKANVEHKTYHNVRHQYTAHNLLEMSHNIDPPNKGFMICRPSLHYFIELLFHKARLSH